MRLRTRTLTTLSVGGLALIAAFMLLLGSFSTTEKAEAAGGSLEGVYDILVHTGAPGSGVYHCISYIADAGGGVLTPTSACYSELAGDPGAEPPPLPGEAGDLLAGPVPPPPYTMYAPQVGAGTLVGPTATYSTCFENGGGASTPNIISVLVDADATADIADSVLSGTTDVYYNEPDGACATDSAVGSSIFTLPTIYYRVADKAGVVDAAGCAASWRTTNPAPPGLTCLNYDGDGCTDTAEVLNTGLTACGDDPYNPHDSNFATADGTYTTLWTAAAGATCGAGELLTQCPFGGGVPDPVGSLYFHCIASVDYISALDINERMYCYTDSPAIDVNSAGYPGCKGDGFPGASPPGVVDPDQTGPGGPSCGGVDVWGDIDSLHTELNGSISGSTLTSTGCFEDPDNSNSLGNLYASASQNVFTLAGTVNIYLDQTLANCLGGTPTGGSAAFSLMAARQSSDFSRDTDGDGCTDAEELDDDVLRDPFNRWDFYDTNGDTVVDVQNDFYPLLAKYGLTSLDPGYDEAFDRSESIAGSNLWNLKGPDGVIDLFGDLLHMASLLGTTCQDSTPPPGTGLLTVEGAMNVAGGKATILAGELVRWTCVPLTPATPVTIRFHHTWGDSDATGIGPTSITNSPPVQLLSVECLAPGNIGTIMVNWVLIDPSGIVRNSFSLAPYSDASATLEVLEIFEAGMWHFAEPNEWPLTGGETIRWRVLDVNDANDQPMLDPDINPETTGLTGKYGWVVADGVYQVQVTKPNCSSNTGGPVEIPPAVDNLHIGITCTDSDGDGLPDYVEHSGAGGTDTDPNDANSDGDTLPVVLDGEEDCDADSLSNLIEVTVTHTDPCGADDVDSDRDGCTNIEELGLNPALGGDRDPGIVWDFYDVWSHPGGDPDAGWERNGEVGLFDDIFGVAFRFGATDDIDGNGVPDQPIDRYDDPLVPPAPTDETGYHPDFDRPPPEGDPWDIGRGDGTIDLFNDIIGVAYQYGHNCLAPPNAP